MIVSQEMNAKPGESSRTRLVPYANTRTCNYIAVKVLYKRLHGSIRIYFRRSVGFFRGCRNNRRSWSEGNGKIRD